MRVLILVALLLAAARGVGATCDVGAGPDLTIGDFYVDKDLCMDEVCFAAVWVYEEANGIGGLQRRDSVTDTTCGFTPDALIIGVNPPL
jgi:hypothetical protein